MAATAQERTEKPTARRRDELRRRGTVARSAEFPTTVSLVALGLVLPAAMRNVVTALSQGMTASLAGAGTSDTRAARALALDAAAAAAKGLAPLLAIVGAASVLASVAVSRARPNPAALRPRADRVSPRQGVKRLASAQSLVELARVLAKLGLVALLGWTAVTTTYTGLVGSGRSVLDEAALVGTGATGFVLRLGLLALVVGVGDAWWSRRRYLRQARMTKQELREELKTTEGNPLIRAAIRGRQRQLARIRMITAVRSADVVLANPTHVAVALRYEPGTSAPVVVAKGAGVVARRIKDEAAAHDVPIVEDRPLARSLWRGCDIGDVIPTELFQAVARVLAAVYAAKRPRLRSTA